VGADKVTCCPLGDGYEFAFQYDYAQAWKRLVENLRRGRRYKRDIPLFVEYKPSETRGHCFVDTAAKALCLLNDIGNRTWASPWISATPCTATRIRPKPLSMLAESPYPYYIHINDNDGRWDWDYFCGTKHFLEYVEFIYYLKRYGYTDTFTSDTSPTRWDIRGTFEANSRMTNKIWNRLELVDGGKIAQLITNGDYLETWKFIETNFFSVD
jgi:xylose isomerase